MVRMEQGGEKGGIEKIDRRRRERREINNLYELLMMMRKMEVSKVGSSTCERNKGKGAHVLHIHSSSSQHCKGKQEFQLQ